MQSGRPRIRIGNIDIDVITFADAINEVEHLVNARQGAMVFTPNVDHVVNAESNRAFRDAYRDVNLSLADGQPLVWASKLLMTPLPEKISGSDFVMPLLHKASKHGWRVYLLGASPHVAEKAATMLREKVQVNIVGFDAPMIEMGNTTQQSRIVSTIKAAHPDIVLVAFGSPKQELFIHAIANELKPAVFLGVGASLDFFVGAVKRAPRWMSHAGLEWLYRLAREPRRLYRRYLVNDMKIFGVLFRDFLRARRASDSSDPTRSDAD